MSRSWEDAKATDPGLEEDLENINEMNGRELMEFIMKVDADTGIAIMVEEGAMEPINAGQLEDYYDDVLREEYGLYELEGCSFTPAEVLKKMAPDAYEKGFNDYTESYVELSQEFPGSQLDGMYMEIEPFFGGKKMDGANDKATVELRQEILTRRPDLVSEREVMALKASTQQAAGAWCPSPQQADDFADRMTAQAQGATQEAPQQQRARARL